MLKKIGLFGGTFDPVHLGHLRNAAAIRRLLSLDEMRLVPCGIPSHRPDPSASPEQRLAMLQLAVQDFPELTIDPCELERGGTSYTVDTLRHYRQKWGRNVSLTWCVGMDAFNGLESWYCWRELFDLAHFVVIQRPGTEAAFPPQLATEVAQRCVQQTEKEKLKSDPAGAVCIVQMESIPISSTQLRAFIRNSDPEAARWLPQTVLNYAHEFQLYR